MISKNGPLDYEIDNEVLMQVLRARRSNKPKYKISISRNIFQEIMKNDYSVDDLNAFINHPNNQDGNQVIHRRNNVGRTPLMFAASCGNNNIVKALLSMGVDISAVDKWADRFTLGMQMWKGGECKILLLEPNGQRYRA